MFYTWYWHWKDHFFYFSYIVLIICLLHNISYQNHHIINPFIISYQVPMIPSASVCDIWKMKAFVVRIYNHSFCSLSLELQSVMLPVIKHLTVIRIIMYQYIMANAMKKFCHAGKGPYYIPYINIFHILMKIFISQLYLPLMPEWK